MSDNFWKTSEGDDLRETDGNFDSGGGNFDPMPDKTTAIAIIDGAEWRKDPNFNEYITLRWSVLKPEAYANRKVFHKLWVTDEDPKAKDGKAKRDKARRMFAAIDKNAGGKLAKAGRQPDEDDMALALFNKPMGIKVGLWELDGDNGPISGNWIMAVMPKGETEVSNVTAPKSAAKRPAADDMDDEIPF